MKTIKNLFTLIFVLTLIACGNDDDATPQNQPPVIENKTIDVPENVDSDLLTTMVATDLEGDVLTYSIMAQTPNGAVSINSSNGEIYIANVSAFDSNINPTITVTVAVTDGINTSTAILTIHVINQD